VELKLVLDDGVGADAHAPPEFGARAGDGCGVNIHERQELRRYTHARVFSNAAPGSAAQLKRLTGDA
jgi:hypothetical protein